MAEQYIQRDGKWYDEHGKQVWRAGTLVYDRKGLVRLFFWLFVGQFTSLMELFGVPALFPLLMASKGFKAGEIGTLWSIWPLGALIVFPVLGVLSDRTRTKWGRRRPYDLLTTPVWFLGLVLLPFIETYWQAFGCMVLVGFAGAGSNVLIGFYNDVVPPELMGRFSGGMRWALSLGVLTVQLVALRLFQTHPTEVFLTLAVIGFAGEMLMLFMIKEGGYPPPPPKENVLKVVSQFVKEGFANRYIIFLWLTMGVTALGSPVMITYFSLFVTDPETGLGLTTTQLGNILAIGTVVGLVLLLPAGWIVDRYGTKKIWSLCGLGVGVLQICFFFFARNLLSVVGLYVVFAAINTVMAATLLPVMYSFIPQDKFGQLNGSNQIVSRVLQFVGASGVGLLIAATNENYGVAFLFGGLVYMLAPVFMYLMLRQPYPYGDLKTTMHPDGNLGRKKMAGQTATLDSK
jgi:MFS family permease